MLHLFRLDNNTKKVKFLCSSKKKESSTNVISDADCPNCLKEAKKINYPVIKRLTKKEEQAFCEAIATTATEHDEAVLANMNKNKEALTKMLSNSPLFGPEGAKEFFKMAEERVKEERDFLEKMKKKNKGLK